MSKVIEVPTPAILGIGDGTRTTWAVGTEREVVEAATVTGVWREDWQGNQPLYATPRTNLIRQSVNLTVAPWTVSPAYAAYATSVRAPRGNRTAFKIRPGVGQSLTSGGFVQSVAKPSPTALRMTWSVFAKAAEFDRIRVFINGADTVNASARGDWRLTDGVLISQNIGSAFSDLALTAVPYPDGWWRFSVTATTDAIAGIGCRIYAQSSSASVGDGVSGIYVDSPQLEVSPVPTSVIDTAAAAVTVTDYSVSPLGVFTFSPAPANGAVLTWTGSYTVQTPIVPPASDFDSYRVDAQQLICTDMLEVFRRNTVMRGIQTGQAAESQQLLDSFVDLWAFRTLDLAVGYYLDVIGRIVGVWPRPVQDAGNIDYFAPDNATTPPDWVPVYVTNAPTSGTVPVGDDTYRTAIRARIIKNHIKYGSAPELMHFAQAAFGIPVSVRNIGLGDLEVVVPASAPPSLIEAIIAETTDETADHKFTLPIPVTGRIVRVFFRYPDAFAPDLDNGAPDVARIGVAHYGVNP